MESFAQVILSLWDFAEGGPGVATRAPSLAKRLATDTARSAKDRSARCCGQAGRIGKATNSIASAVFYTHKHVMLALGRGLEPGAMLGSEGELKSAGGCSAQARVSLEICAE